VVELGGALLLGDGEVLTKEDKIDFLADITPFEGITIGRAKS
jgi:hypothetical protein